MSGKFPCMACLLGEEALTLDAAPCDACAQLRAWQQRHQWIPKSMRPPTASDGDVQGCVLVWHQYNGAMVMIWQHAAENPYIMEWMPTPAHPPTRQ